MDLTGAERERLLHGSSEPFPERIPLCAGPFDLTLEAGDLRAIRLGSREVIRRIYGAVRDERWGTVPSCLSEVSLDAGPDRFRVTYRSDHHDRDVHFAWQAQIEGHLDGTIRFRFDGTALSAFRRNRVGLCVLHPIRGVAGRRVRATLVAGAVRDLVFPVTISLEQPITGLHGLAGLAHEVEPGVWVEVTFGGEVFETEDQRNWIDASYKTYGTPLSLPIPVEVAAGARVVQDVTVRLRREAASAFAVSSSYVPRASGGDRADDVLIAEAQGPVRPVPSIGIQLAPDDRPLGDEEIAVLRLVQPAHVRVDLHLADPSWSPLLFRAARETARLDCPMELALHLPAETEEALDRLGEVRLDSLRIARLLVFTEGRATTASASLEAVRRWVHPSSLSGPPIVGTGTTGDLYRLSLQRPPLADLVCWSMNPQVHAVDATSIAETPEGARDQIESMKRYYPRARLAVSPITLGPGGKPDRRHASLFAAGWTLAMLRALGEAGADSLTFFDAAGPAGLMDAGGIFPVFHVFAAVASVPDASVVATSSTTEEVAALWLTCRDGDSLLLANLSRRARFVRWPSTFRAARLARVDASEGIGRLRDPHAFRRTAAWGPKEGVTLPPFGLARINGDTTSRR